MNIKKIIIATACLFFLMAGSVSAQSADAVSDMIETPAVRFRQAAYFMASYAIDSDVLDELDSLTFCIEEGLCENPDDPDKFITLSSFAGMCMRTFNLKGGLLYSITHANHYAFREMQAKGYIPRSADPAATVTGSEALMIITECIHAVEEGTL